MNDQHPYAGYAGYDGHSTGGFDSDPLFGSLPGDYDGSYDTTTAYAAPYGSGQADYSGTYDASQWDTGAHRTAEYGHSADYTAHTAQPQQQPQQHHPYDAAPQYDTGATWIPADVGYGHTIPAQHGAPDSSGQWDSTAWHQNGQWADTGTAGYDTGTYDTGAYDATAWNTGATPEHEHQSVHTATAPHASEQTAQHPYAANEPYQAYEQQAAPETTYEHETTYEQQSASHDPYEPYRTAEFSLPETGTETGTGSDPDAEAGDSAHSEAEDHTGGHESAPDAVHRPAGRPVTRSTGGSRSRRRSPAKRSALLTVAVPSACVMSVAGIAAASVGGMGGGEEKKDETTTMAAADPGTVKPVAANNALDTQLANLSADAENFADRASRTQERIDLKERQAAEKKKRAEEAARKEALRPKFVMPVKDHRLSAYFGQAGVNWMSVHTGIDFPVDYGTPVMSATDGTVRTQFNTAYGNMAIVTAADGTETWYCHLSSTRIRSGSVKAGDVIAYSGDSGNSTGPHMHFEVRPGGGAAIDPLPWLRSHNVNPN
ncbi:M23 family metallopeptidase [Streptomyces sp. NBC_01022]|uniref:M23 family metallopeptidase n=1 Tax=Streptomyces sp. NBC_01022 TaxID=2903723 RepID=UPI002DDABA0B|nr:M23 family metallopeptidase [Streptomyces sp. NBC_01022]WRZ83855.1 M23 family metallopeptidase [Streptomyces sp. NBC_01022]